MKSSLRNSCEHCCWKAELFVLAGFSSRDSTGLKCDTLFSNNVLFLIVLFLIVRHHKYHHATVIATADCSAHCIAPLCSSDCSSLTAGSPFILCCWLCATPSAVSRSHIRLAWQQCPIPCFSSDLLLLSLIVLPKNVCAFCSCDVIAVHIH
jgi:hypothetical protein